MGTRKDYVSATLNGFSKKGSKASTSKSAANEKNSTVHAKHGLLQETIGVSTVFWGKRANLDARRSRSAVGPDNGAAFTKIKPFFTCFHRCPQAILQQSLHCKGTSTGQNLCVQQSFLFPQKGCWLPSGTLFWRMPDMGSYQCLRLKQRSRSSVFATFARL